VPDPDELLAIAASVGVTKVVQIGCDVEYARHSVELARSRPDVVVGVSVHPNDAARIHEKQGAAALDAAIDEIAVPSVSVALSPLFTMFVICARPRSASAEDVSMTAIVSPIESSKPP
jgi:Tat protein secretion system quality control protein TatD with DNase activity